MTLKLQDNYFALSSKMIYEMHPLLSAEKYMTATNNHSLIRVVQTNCSN